MLGEVFLNASMASATAIHSNTANSACSLSVVNLLRRKPARAAVAPAQPPRGWAFEPDTEPRLPPRFRPGIAPPVGAQSLTALLLRREYWSSRTHCLDWRLRVLRPISRAI